MTAESGDNKGRSEGSMAEFEGSKGEFEVKRGGDLMDNGTVHGDGKEIGGSYVIINGDSNDHSEKDLDLGEDLDPVPNADSGGAENEELTLENGRDGGKEKSLLEDGELASGDEGKDEEEKEYGDSIRDILVGDEQRASESGSDVKVEGDEQVPEGLVSEPEEVAKSESKTEEIQSDSLKVEEIEKCGDSVVEGEAKEEDGERQAESVLAENVEIEGEKTMNEKQNGEALVVVDAEEEMEETPVEQESAVADACKDSQQELGSEFDEEDTKEIQTVVAETRLEEAMPTAQRVEEEETDHLQESESASLGHEEQRTSELEESEPSSQVKKEQEESVLAESTDRGDAVSSVVEGSPNITVEVTNVADSKSTVHVEAEHEPETVFEVVGSVQPVENQESKPVIEDTAEQVERQIEAERQHEAVLAVNDTIEAEEVKVSEAMVEASDYQADGPSAVVAETNQGLDAVVSAASVTEAEGLKGPELVPTVSNRTSEHLSIQDEGEESSVVSNPTTIEAEVRKEPEEAGKEIRSLEDLEETDEQVERQIEADQEHEAVLAVTDTIEAEEVMLSEAMVEESDYQADAPSAVVAETNQGLEAVLSAASIIEAEGLKEPELVSTESTRTSEHLSIQNGGEESSVVSAPNTIEAEVGKEREKVGKDTRSLEDLEETYEQVERQIAAEQEHEAVLAVTDTIEAEEVMVSEAMVEESDYQADAPSAVVAETNQGLEAVLSAASITEAEGLKELELVSTESTRTSEHLPVQNGGEERCVVSTPNTIEAKIRKEQEEVSKEIRSLEDLEETSEQVERQIEAEQEHEAVLPVTDTIEAEEVMVSEAMVEESDYQADAPSAVVAETNQGLEAMVSAASITEAEGLKGPELVPTESTRTSEHLPIQNGEESSVVSTPNTIEAEVRKEPEEVGKEIRSLEDLSNENVGAEKPGVPVDSALDESSGQLENPSSANADATLKCDVNESTGSGAEINCHILKDDLSGETTDLSLEISESPHPRNVTGKELVGEVNHSADSNHVEEEVSKGEIIPSEPKNDASVEDDEARLTGPDNDADVKQPDCKISHHEVTELEKKDWGHDAETNRDVAVEIIKLKTESGNESTEDSECMVSSTEGNQSTNKDDDEKHINDQDQAAAVIAAPPETHVVKLHHLYMIKVPRFIDDELQQKIEHARLMVEEKTKIRDSIGEKARKQAAIFSESEQDYNDAYYKERAAQVAFSAKRQEIEKYQALINSATSISDIDDKIRNMVHKQQHETISLKQEKQYINEINQLKRLREQLSSKRAPQEELDRALSQKDEIEARLKSLRKELDSLRAALSSAESSAKSASDRYAMEREVLLKLKEEHNAADGARQAAYLQWRKLRNQSFEKARHFKTYKADQSTATNYRFSGDNQGLRSHCSKQVERIMELWNNDKEFREQYVKSNTHSTVRRLGTLDGRSLGPDEESPVIRTYVNRSSTAVSAVSPRNRGAPAPVLAREVIHENLAEPLASTKQVERTNQLAKSKSPAKLTACNGADPKEEERMDKLRKEEEELARKQEEFARKEEELRKAKAAEEEELRKEKAAAELKEQLRLEQKAKAREAEERKRRKAEKAQVKAEFRALKEAELREKKKAKKENKKPGTVDTTNGGAEGESSAVSVGNLVEMSQKVEEASSTASTSRKKRTTRPASSVKQYAKVQSPVPLPLRNKSKRKMTTWMWALLVTLLVIGIFIAGNYLSFSPSDKPGFGF